MFWTIYFITISTSEVTTSMEFCFTDSTLFYNNKFKKINHLARATVVSVVLSGMEISISLFLISFPYFHGEFLL